MKTLDREIVSLFLASADTRKIAYPNVAEMIVQWLERGRWHDIDLLANECWDRIA